MLFSIRNSEGFDLGQPQRLDNYAVLLITEGEGTYHADFGAFPYAAPVLLFSTPLQQIRLEEKTTSRFTLLQFHGDFYCIEYHKEQVACNGLLFNSIYIQPSVHLTESEASSFERILNDISAEFADASPDETILQSYLQLLLAKASNIKIRLMQLNVEHEERDEKMEQFIQLLEKNYLKLHKPSEYAELLAMSPNNFSKWCARYFKKSPSEMIHERIILEAKKKLHLTRQSIKEIAYALNFTDEFYFSRFFKKYVKVSPQTYREKTGISIVADLPV
ncbi:MAG: helix-turn-helix domain-containing protein [Bacteroidetes bacterium]|nr:helix-turn-helix domain-containing protein [Bacteroidota bacterium]